MNLSNRSKAYSLRRVRQSWTALKPAVITEISLEITTIRYLELVKTLIVYDPEVVGDLLTKEFVERLLQILQDYPHHNILHNSIKDILLESISRSYQVIVPLLLSEGSLFVSLVKSCSCKNASQTKQYENQIFHIFQALLRKG